MQKVLKLSRTIRRFKASQLGGKFSYEFKKFCFEKKLLRKSKKYNQKSSPLNFIPLYAVGCSVSGKKFFLLNRSKEFREKINWNFKGFGKLWNIILNTFEYLNTEKVSAEEGIAILHSFIHQ